jgi:SsrA-binding protein
MAKPDTDAPRIESIAKNRRARFEYQVLDTWEAGIVLTGTEVKALRDGRANVTDAFGVVNAGEIYLLNLHISPYERAGYSGHLPTRTRKLLLHRREIEKLIGAVERKGHTLVPLEVYFKDGKAKVRLALAVGKKLHDKREDLKKKDDERAMQRAMKK